MQAAVGQFHHDEQVAVDDLDAVHRQQERVADRLDVLEGAQLLGGAVGGVAEVAAPARDELDRLDEATGRFALPDLAEAAFAQRLEQAVAW